MSRTRNVENDTHRASPQPDIAVTVTRKIDEDFAWDGDGPDPADEGFEPYIVTVRAATIRRGRLYVGASTLSGCYYSAEEPIGDIHGYYPQMLEEALAELASEVAAAERTL